MALLFPILIWRTPVLLHWLKRLLPMLQKLWYRNQPLIFPR